ncbi:MAG: polysaccharide deacetylase family protein, partial [Dehalococcoidia bacterium]|nr:polysaccharide deacetylase family protein [Dehalococcoidia bacterium]
MASRRIESSPPTVFLTFDDGPCPPFTSEILDILKDHVVPATFFVCGRNVERHPDLAKRIVREGHSIGNHTFSHSK